MEVDIDLACVNRKGVLPKAILAARTFQIEPGNRETIVEQYRTLWNTDEETWSTAETIIQYMRNAGKGEQESEHELKELIEVNRKEYELPVLKTGECTEEDIEAAIENWMDDKKYNDRGKLTTQSVRM
eukprot:gene5894-7096_t